MQKMNYVVKTPQELQHLACAELAFSSIPLISHTLVFTLKPIFSTRMVLMTPVVVWLKELVKIF